MSIATAVAPVTAIGVPYFAAIAGSRRGCARTSSWSSGSLGPVVGITWMIAVSSVAFGVPALTDSTPGSVAIRSPMAFRSSTTSVVWVMSTVTISGPLRPGPNAVG